MPQQLHAIIHGRVQGVGFRWHTQTQAQKLELTGTVRNCSDGTVEIFAEGSQQNLESLLTFLAGENGPGSITEMNANYSPATEKFRDFTIIH